MHKIKEYVNANREFFAGTVFILGLMCYGVVTNFMFIKHGTITIAEVTKEEAAADGYNVYLKVYYKGRTYNNVANSFCNACVGKFFFVKIINGNPSQDVILYNENVVPVCMLEQPLPPDGWKEFPVCSSSQ